MLSRITDLDDDVFEGWRQDVPSHRYFISNEIYSDVNPSDLSKIRKIGLGAATTKLKARTQRMIRSFIMPISRQYRTDHMFEWPCIKQMMVTDTMEGR